MLIKRHNPHSGPKRPLGTHLWGSRRFRAARLPVRRSGFTLLELAVSAGIFLLAAGLISITVSRAVVGDTMGRSTATVSTDLSDLLNQLSTNSYASLLSGSYTPPDSCDSTRLLDGGSSCMTLFGSVLEVSYDITPVTSAGSGDSSVGTVTAQRSDGLTITATGKWQGGSYSATRFVSAPVPSYAEGEAVVRVRVTGSATDLAALTTPIYLLRKVGSSYVTVSSASLGSDGVALVRVSSPDLCSYSTPCVAGLSSGSDFPATAPLDLSTTSSLSSILTLTSASVTGANADIITTADSVTSVTVEITHPGTLTIETLARDAFSGALIDTPSSAAGSLCLYLKVPTASGFASAPTCNTSTSSLSTASTLSFTSYHLDPTDLTSPLLPLPLNTPLTLITDPATGFCGAPGQKAFYAASVSSPNPWSAAAECTSYTWGYPAGIGGVGSIPAGVGASDGSALSTPLTLTEGVNLSKEVVFDGSFATPATGASVAGGPVAVAWSRPRFAETCAGSATCTNDPTTLPESVACSGGSLDCLRSTPPPYVSTPTPGSNSTLADSVGYSSTVSVVTALPLSVTQAAGAPSNSLTLDLTAANLPTGASLTVGGVAVSSFPVVISSGSSTYTAPTGTSDPGAIDYTLPAGATNVGSLQFVATDGNGAVNVFWLALCPGVTTLPWQLTTSSVNATQASGSATSTLTVIGGDGNPVAGEIVNLSYATGISGPSTVTTGSGGSVSIPVTWIHSGSSTPAAGSYKITATASAADGGRSSEMATTEVESGGSGYVKISQSPGTLNVSATGATQGGSGTASVTLNDVSGRAWSGSTTPVILQSIYGVTGVGALAVGTYPNPHSCILSSGSCTVPLVIEKSTAAGGYSLTATMDAGGSALSNYASYSVTQRLYGATATPSTISVKQGGQGNTLVTFTDGSSDAITGVSATYAISGGSGVSVFSSHAEGVGERVVVAATSTASFSAKDDLVVSYGGEVIRRVPITIVPIASSISGASTASIRAGSAGLISVTALTSTGAHAAGVTLLVSGVGLPTGVSLTSSTVTTNSSGVANFNVKVDGAVLAGSAGDLTFAQVVSGVTGATIGSVVLNVTSSVATASISQITSGGVALIGSSTTLSVTALDSAASPISGADVTVYGSSTTGLVITADATTDSLGKFNLYVSAGSTVIPGKYKVEVTIGNYYTTLSVPVTT